MVLDLTSLLTLSGITTVAVAGATMFLKQYLGKKAENLATKEDLADLTRPVEAIKLEFKLQEERARAAHGRDLAAHRVLFEHEFVIYRDLWKQVLDVRAKLDHYSSHALVAAKHGSAINMPGYDEVRKAVVGLSEYAELHKPFFAPNVNMKLLMLHVVLRRIAVETSMLKGISDEQIQERIKRVVAEIGDNQRALESAIRERLYPELWLPLETKSSNEVSAFDGAGLPSGANAV